MQTAYGSFYTLNLDNREQRYYLHTCTAVVGPLEILALYMDSVT